jgi:Common central domain of tyrosinase
MALGDGIRRNIRTVTLQERERFRDALLALQTKKVCIEGSWVDPDEMLDATRAHRGPAFLPWHRTLCNRLEQLLREIDPQLSLHYWDWNEDPHELFTPTFMTGSFQGSPFEGLLCGSAWTPPDSEIVDAPTYQTVRTLLERKHDAAHFVYFGGTFVNAHISFHDPYALLLHSNVDRLFAMWQAQVGKSWRLDPSVVYGSERRLLNAVMTDRWATESTARPWMSLQQQQAPPTYAHPSIVAPPCYDTLPTRVTVDHVTNPGNVINFHDVHRGKTFARAASFLVFGRGNLTFAVTSGPTGPYSVITPGGAVMVAHSPSLYQEARIWFGFTGGVPNSKAPRGTVTIRCYETNQEFTFVLQGNTAAQTAPRDLQSIEGGGPSSEAEESARLAGITWTWTWKPA